MSLVAPRLHAVLRFGAICKTMMLNYSVLLASATTAASSTCPWAWRRRASAWSC